MGKEWLSSNEAARRLGVSSATLYAYVSRGLLRSEGSNGQRERRYSADDVTLLKRRRGCAPSRWCRGCWRRPRA